MTIVLGKVDILVLGKKPGPSKIKKAEELGIQIMSLWDMYFAIRDYFDDENENDETEIEDSNDEDEDISKKEKAFWICLVIIIGIAGKLYLLIKH